MWEENKPLVIFSHICPYITLPSGIVKTLYIRKQERTAQGKKITALDERYMRTAENELYSELSLTLGIPKDEMEQYIRERLTQ